MLDKIADACGRYKAPEKAKKEAKKNLEVFSDENLKQVYGDDIDDRIIEDFARLSAIDYKYNETAQEMGCDNKEHTGVIAQELEAMPTTAHCVEDNGNGFKAVDVGQMAMTDTAAIAELSRRVLALEKVVRELSNRG